MKHTALFLFAVLAAILGPIGCEEHGSPNPPAVQVYFSPQGGCTEAIVSQLAESRTSILVQAYSFTSSPIAKALVDAHERGVDVRVILDKSQRTEKYSSADFLVHAGIPTAIDAEHAIAHNKVMVVDGEIVITGSFNFTKSAENNNAENLLILRDAWLAGKYTANWTAHAQHSEPYSAKSAENSSPAAPHASGASLADVARGSANHVALVASNNSEIFHRSTCRSAVKIAANHREGFATRAEAMAAGKRPCGECKP
jgi:hypothetical protein